MTGMWGESSGYDVDVENEQVHVDVQLLNRPVRYEPFETFPQPAGAECVFLGRTRIEQHPEHGRLERLAYEAYEPLAEKTLQSLAQRAAERFDCLAVRIHHTIGEVLVGEASVLVQTVCGHRQQSFEATRFLIDRLKLEAPIWKRELWADGTTWSEGAPVDAPQQMNPQGTQQC